MEQPHAVRATFNARSRAITVVYSNGFSCGFRVAEAPVLKEMGDADFSDPRVSVGGDGLIFEKANVAVSLPMVLAKVLPFAIGQSWAASHQGSKRSTAKAAAARANGARGGRPKKAQEPALSQ